MARSCAVVMCRVLGWWLGGCAVKALLSLSPCCVGHLAAAVDGWLHLTEAASHRVPGPCTVYAACGVLVNHHVIIMRCVTQQAMPGWSVAPLQTVHVMCLRRCSSSTLGRASWTQHLRSARRSCCSCAVSCPAALAATGRRASTSEAEAEGCWQRQHCSGRHLGSGAMGWPGWPEPLLHAADHRAGCVQACGLGPLMVLLMVLSAGGVAATGAG
mmetsp:Transcript_21651/g.55114  ORF Transcript_21651/g.55114 Transcript_21651/m.55114 type:complete len:214 (-) Transcript_21651:29-670(-)